MESEGAPLRRTNTTTRVSKFSRVRGDVVLMKLQERKVKHSFDTDTTAPVEYQGYVTRQTFLEQKQREKRLRIVKDEEISEQIEKKGESDFYNYRHHKAWTVKPKKTDMRQSLLELALKAAVDAREASRVNMFNDNPEFIRDIRLFVRDKIVDARWFDPLINIIILCNCFTLALSNPTMDTDSTLYNLLEITEVIFLTAFTVEMGLKLIALGFWAGERGYFKVGGQMFDYMFIGRQVVHAYLYVYVDISTSMYVRVDRLAPQYLKY